MLPEEELFPTAIITCMVLLRGHESGQTSGRPGITRQISGCLPEHSLNYSRCRCRRERGRRAPHVFSWSPCRSPPVTRSHGVAGMCLFFAAMPCPAPAPVFLFPSVSPSIQTSTLNERWHIPLINLLANLYLQAALPVITVQPRVHLFASWRWSLARHGNYNPALLALLSACLS